MSAEAMVIFFFKGDNGMNHTVALISAGGIGSRLNILVK
jgi:hypothetical protein